MKIKCKRKTISIIIAISMLITVFNIPLLGYAGENQSKGEPVAKNNYVLGVWDSDAYDEETDSEGDYVSVTTDGIKIDDYYGMLLDYQNINDGEEPNDDFEIRYIDPAGEEPDPAIPYGTIKISSSNEAVAKISYYNLEDDYYEELSKEVEFVADNWTAQYFKVFYLGEGSSTITITNEEAVLDEDGMPTEETVAKEIGAFNVGVSMGDLPDVAITDYEQAIDSWAINWHDVYKEDSDARKYVYLQDMNHQDSSLDGEKISWKCDNNNVDIEANGTEAEIIVPRSIGVVETPVTITAVYTDPLGDKYESTMTISTADFGVRETSWYDEEEYDYWNIIEDETYTDTDNSLYLGAFKSDNTKLEGVKWTSADEAIVKVGRKGRVYPLGVGTTEVTATITLENGAEAIKTFKITVYDPDVKGKLKYILNESDKTAAVYSARDKWDGKIPATVTIRGTEYTVTSMMDRFDFYSEDPITVTLPKTMENVGDAFRWQYGVKYISVNSENPFYDSYKGVLYNEGKTMLIAYPAGKTSKSFEIPSSVTTIDDFALTNDHLTKIYAPKNLKIEDPFADDFEGFESIEGNDAKYYIHPENTEMLKIFEYIGWKDYEMDFGQITEFKAASVGTSSVKLSWKQSDNIGVKGYRIYQLKNGSYKEIGKTTGTSFTAKNLSAGSGYKFRVKAYGTFETIEGGTKTAYSTAATATLSSPTKPTKAALSKLTTGSKYIKAYWYKRTGTGYQVYVATNSKFNKGLKKYTVKSPSTLNKKVTKLKKGTTYYVKVRAYKTYDGKTQYGAWSSYKKIKCK